MEKMKKNKLFIGSGSGSGSGSGYGSGDGYGDGYGSGSGSGSGYGSGDGSGYGDGVQCYNYNIVHYIDDLPTLIFAVHKTIARGAIVNGDLTLTDCYIAKVGLSFAHAATVREAVQEATIKDMEHRSLNDRLTSFMSQYPNLDIEVPGEELFVWHHTLTGSCTQGRQIFCENHSIDVKNYRCTVRRFIELTKNSFGGEIIKKLENLYQTKKE